jgi:hypothetical protein
MSVGQFQSVRDKIYRGEEMRGSKISMEDNMTETWDVMFISLTIGVTSAIGSEELWPTFMVGRHERTADSSYLPAAK